jgi:type I restriction enzyme M protein
MWSDEVKVGMRPRLARFPKDRERDKYNQEHFRYFDFDVLLTNPPFAGTVKESRIIHQFELAKNKGGRWVKKASRDVLFLERNLDFLRPGGRMAIVLPQGRVNNVSDSALRSFVGERARVLASISLHVNTFKPHANIKTTILFLQKWNDDAAAGPLCPRATDYPIFFAMSEDPGKDNLGNYVVKVGPDNAPELDEHGHMTVLHDLDEIASAFMKWAKSQKISFHPRGR